MNHIDQAYPVQPPPAPPLSAPETKALVGSRIGLQALARLCHNVGTALHAGVDVRQVFATEAQRGPVGRRRHLRIISERIAQGDSLAEAFRATGNFFPPLICEMIDVGEKTGRMEEVFFRLAQHYNNVLNLRRTFLTGIAWPLIELTIAVLAIGGFILLLGLVWNQEGPPPISFFGLYGVSGFLIYAFGIGSIVFAVALTILAVTKEWIDLGPLYMLLTYLPGIGTGLRIMAISRLTWSLSLATDSELSPQRAIELSLRTTQNPFYTRHVREMSRSVAGGASMIEAFRQPGVFPADFLDVLETGELTGRISESMATLAEDYEQKVRMFFRLFSLLAGVGVFLLVAGMLIAMIMSLAMQYIGILEDAANI